MDKSQRDLLTEAKLRMLRAMPYYGTFVVGTDLLEDKQIPTACTDMRSIRYNPDWLLRGGDTGKDLRDREEVVFVLGHEVLHMTFKHGIRMGFRDPALWNVACVHGDTKVLMADGREIAIKNLRGGSLVASPYGPNKIRLVTKAKKSSMVELCFSNGRKVTSTNEHLFLTTSGFLEAGQIKEGQTVIVDSRVQRVCEQELSRDDSSGDGVQSRVHVSTDGVVSEVLWTSPSEEVHPPTGIIAQATDRPGGVGVSGGDCGRRGDNLHRQRFGEGQEILSTAHHDQHYVSKACGLGGESGDVWLSMQEYQRTALLEDYGFRMGDRTVASWDDATFEDQEEARRVAHRLHLTAKAATRFLHVVARYGDDLLTNQGLERARVTHTRAYTETTEVYDLVTDAHCYVAEGVVVHNCDYAINWILHEGEVGKMPAPEIDEKTGKPHPQLLDEKFKGMSAEDIYDLLEKEHKKQGGGSKLKMGGVVIDLSKSDPGGMGGFERPVNADGSGLTDAQKSALERELDGRTSASAATAKSQGKLPAGLERFIQTALKPEVDWRERLRLFVAKTFPSDYTWRKPNRRHLWGDLYLYSQEKTGTGKILCIMDTSGSVDYGNEKSEGAQYFSEIKAIFEDCMPEQLHVMYCDAEVAGYDIFDQGEEPTLKPRGGGGTDFRPPFRRVEKDGLEIQCAIYLTDGMGQFPEKAMPYPVLWVCTTDVIAPWGDTIRIMKNRS